MTDEENTTRRQQLIQKRLAYPVTQPGYDGSAKAMQGDFQKNASFLKSLGYNGIELLIQDPDTLDINAIDRALLETRLRIAAIGTSPMQLAEHLFLLHEDAAKRMEAIRRLHALLRLCARYRAPLLIGKYRGMTADAKGQRMEDLAEIIAKACNEAKQNGTSILIEPQNKDSINNLNTIAETLSFIQGLSCDNLGILADTYHIAISESSPTESIRKAGNKIGFVHLSDSKRLIPGKGKLPLDAMLYAFQDAGYNGFYSFETMQSPNSYTAAAQAASFLQNDSQAD